VQHDEDRRRRGTVEPIDVDEVAVGQLPSLAAQRQARPRPQQGPEDRLRMRAAKPPRRPEPDH
jgi:hypothetical protein